MRQLDLYGNGAAGVDGSFGRLVRTTLTLGAWVEHGHWLSGHEVLFESLRVGTDWHSERRMMYGREVDTPRLVARAESPPPILEVARKKLSARYGQDFARVSYAYYRDGGDSVAPHGDTIARDLPEALVATLTLGATRRMLLTPTEGGPSLSVTLSGGDLFVMGGSAQRTWRHGIPKVAHAGPRIAVMFRPIW